MTLAETYRAFLECAPRRTNECWLGRTPVDDECGVFVCGYRFLAHLRGPALRIWFLLDGTRSVSEIVDELSLRYRSGDHEAILEDAIRYIVDLEQLGLAAWRSRPLFEDVQLDD